MSTTSEILQEAQIIKKLLEDCGITEYEPQLIPIILQMSCRITRKILKDAQDVSQYTGKKEIETEHAGFAMNVFDETFHPIVDRQRLIELAIEKNNQPLPTSKNFGMRLPNARFSLTQPNYQVPSRQIQKFSQKRDDSFSLTEPSMNTSYEIRPVQIVGSILD